MKPAVAYSAAVLGYIVLAMFTKEFLTWTWGPIYFMTVLEVLPRIFARIRRRFAQADQPVPEQALKT